MMQIGAPCHWCEVGLFFGSGWFDFYTCPTCMDKYLGCEVCHGKGIIAVPRQDITQELSRCRTRGDGSP